MWFSSLRVQPHVLGWASVQDTGNVFTSSFRISSLPTSPTATLENSPVLHAKVDNQYIFIGSLQELKDINLLGRVAGKPRLCPQLPEGPGLISGLIWAPTPIISEGYLSCFSPTCRFPLSSRRKGSWEGSKPNKLTYLQAGIPYKLRYFPVSISGGQG